MTSDDRTPTPDGEDLAALRETIDELKSTPTEQLIDPLPGKLEEDLPTPERTDAIGSEKWNESAEDEITDV